MKVFLPTLLIGAIATMAYTVSPALAADEKSEAEKAKKPKKITDRRHPDYIRCRSEPIIGSLARKRRICMTNAEWVIHTREGGKRSKEFVDDLQSGMNNTPGG